MAESFVRLSKNIWVLLAGIGLGAVAVLLWGGAALWGLAALALAALVLPRWLGLAQPVARQAESNAKDPLPPLARSVLEQLPAPVLLLDVNERVLFANGPMRDVLGADI